MRTAEQKRTDRDSVRSNLRDLGPHGALQFARRELTVTKPHEAKKRRLLIMTVFAAARELERDCRDGRRMARCHRQGMKQAKQW